MIDMHCHILPEIDDGAQDIGVSVRMCRLSELNGVRHIIATPHIAALDDKESFLERRHNRIKLLRGELKSQGINVKIYPGAEVFVDDDVFFASGLEKLTINGGRYILIEFAFSDVRVNKIVDYINHIRHEGLIPIIAHPERYEFFQEDYEAVNFLSKNGVLFQINAASLASLDGPQEFELAYAMAYNSVASFIGTDAHSLNRRPPNLGEMIKFFPPDISRFNLQMMLKDCAKCVLNDEPIPMIMRGQIHKRGF